ncbi:hypothetical protein ABZP36_025454 [Zizania latifolia]
MQNWDGRGSAKIWCKNFDNEMVKCAMAKIKPKTLLAQSKQKKGPTQIGPTTIITYIVLKSITSLQ